METHIPTVTDKEFNIPEVSQWHIGGKGPSQFLNNLSIYFPEGEMFFIKSVQAYRNNIKKERLKLSVKNFVRQEANHTREHERYNEAIRQMGFNVDKFEDLLSKLLGFGIDFLPEQHQLAVTIALEHLTAMMGEILIDHAEDYINGSEEQMTELWKWHAWEEIDHKNVAFDVYKDQCDSYIIRLFWLCVQTAILITLEEISQQFMLKAANASIKDWIKCYNYKIGPNGFIWKMVPGFISYFNPNFHPLKRDVESFKTSLSGVLIRSAISQVQSIFRK